MALIQCRECTKEVSSTAMKCPHCGYRLRKPKRSFMGKLFKWTFVLWNLLMLAWLVGGLASASNVEATGAAEEAGRDAGIALGVGVILVIWTLGSVLLGLFVLLTRPKS